MFAMLPAGLTPALQEHLSCKTAHQPCDLFQVIHTLYGRQVLANQHSQFCQDLGGVPAVTEHGVTSESWLCRCWQTSTAM